MTARRILISGRVHGVGYRDWMIATAQRLGVPKHPAPPGPP